MKIFLLIFCCSLAHFSQAQVDSRNIKSIQKIVGSDFIIVPNQKNYPYSSMNQKCAFQPSNTLHNDTTGISFNNEYLLFRSPIGFSVGNEALKFMKPTYVTVGEYLDFQEYIRDSIAREKIYSCIDKDEIASKFIQHEDTYYDRAFEEMKKFNPSARDRNRHRDPSFDNSPLFPFDWNHAFSYADTALMPCLADMYLPLPERIYKIRAFDERKLAYRFIDHYEQFDMLSAEEIGKRFKYLGQGGDFNSIVHQAVTSLSDTYYWSANSTSDRDEFSVLGQLYNQTNLHNPVIGITGMQANAFCHWKQIQLQQEMNHKGLKYRVFVTMPAFDDISAGSEKKMTIPEKDYTSQWKITADDYQKFVEATKDSILREILYEIIPSDSIALKLLNYPAELFDEGYLSNVQFSKYFKEWGRFTVHNSDFPLNYKFKINRESFNGLAGKVMDSIVYQNPNYQYFYFDAKERSIVGKLMIDSKRNLQNDVFFNSNLELLLKDVDSLGEPIGKDLNLDFGNILEQSSGTRGYENLRRLIHQKTVSIVPDNLIDMLVPKSLIQGISYEQAIAFYYWKYPIHKVKSTDNWQDFVLPSEAQFKKVQQGESLIFPAKEVNFPTPVFRYVVHVFPAN